MDKLRNRALDVAMEGRTHAEAMAQLCKDFADDDTVGAAEIRDALDYAFTGGESGLGQTPADKVKVANYCKRKARKARVMLAVNYDKNDIGTSVYDALADIMHLCEREGIDFEEALESGVMHFQAERMGGEHG